MLIEAPDNDADIQRVGRNHAAGMQLVKFIGAYCRDRIKGNSLGKLQSVI